ncbi:Mobile element protein [Azospirillum melinis]
MLADRGVAVDHTTLFRWIQAYAPELDKRLRQHLRTTTGSCRVDETYVRVKGRWMYLYRAADGLPTHPLHKNAAYPDVTKAMKKDSELWWLTKLRQAKCLNNIGEQDHRPIKRLIRLGLGFERFHAARRTIAGYTTTS